MKRLLILLILLMQAIALLAEDGYRLWLRYDPVSNPALLQRYRAQFSSILCPGSSPTAAAARTELRAGLEGLLAKKIPTGTTPNAGSVLAFSRASAPAINLSSFDYETLGDEGFIIRTVIEKGKQLTVITANTDVGVLYGVYHFLRLLQTQQNTTQLAIVSRPKIKLRILDHWDNLNRTVERGYAGLSIWNWHELPGYIDQRYIDYARANASVGINGSVLTNVNANALVLTPSYLLKVKALADLFRTYGIRVYLTVRFSAPIEIGGLKTADPLDESVKNWWRQKADEIYRLIPDFGGFLVKANSEGQPGPQTYGRSHADGANMLADAVAPHKGIVMWRAFVYDARVQKKEESFDSANHNTQNIASADRFKQAYTEFTPFDGAFRPNVLIQVKNGPIDFQPREPFSPLFSAMPRTPLMMEFQLTQEYLGQGTHLAFEAPLFKETLDADTYAKGKGSTVARIIDGSVNNHALTGMAGVANIGNERNWTNHPFAQANWYAFGRLAWDHDLTASQIADEWIRQTFSNDKEVVSTLGKMMLDSRETLVNYMTPLGLHHIMATGHHYGPGPWVSNLGRADWNPVYYHRADAYGIGFDRTNTGSDALAQYALEAAQAWKDSNSCDDKYLLWFHHVSWQHKMQSGRTLWEELGVKYQSGVDAVRGMQNQWNSLASLIDGERFRQVRDLLAIQEGEAEWWRNACLLYFQIQSKLPWPKAAEVPDHTLDYYQSLKFPFAPGIGGNN